MRKRIGLAVFGAVLGLALARPAAGFLDLVGSLVNAISGGASIATLVDEARKRFDQLQDMIDQLQGLQDTVKGELREIGGIAQQLGSGYRGLYTAGVGLVQDTLSLPSDLQVAHGDFLNSLTGAAGSGAPADAWRAYTGQPVAAKAFAGTLGSRPDSRLAEALENAQLAIQRFETLGNAVRQASHNAGRLVAEAATANEKQKEFAQLEKMSQAALLQKIIAVQLATNELLGSLVQIQSLSAAGGTLASEERSRAWNAAARQLAEGRTEVETETARLESLRKAAALETGVGNLFSLDWTIQGS